MKPKIAIIGAGMAGVSAARRLTEQGCSVTLFEKSRGFGGRCASKRWEGHVIDHGAQYFTLRDERFRDAVRAASGEAVTRIAAPVLDACGDELPDCGRHYHREGNSRVVRDLAAGMDVRTSVTIERADSLLRRAGGEFDRVVSTAPFPQTARLFGIESDFASVPCLAAILVFRGEWAGLSRDRYAVRDREGPLAWSACENHKSGRIAPGYTVMVAHMSEAFSREHLERSPADYPALALPLVAQRWELPADTLVASHGHRWRYARVSRPIGHVELPTGLHFAGDALTASRVEDAWLAGLSVAEQAFRE